MLSSGILMAGGVLTGCGTSHSASGSTQSSSGAADASPAASVETARTATANAKSARLALEETVRVDGKAQSVHGSGVTRMGDSGAADGQFTLSAAGQNVQMRVLGTTLYEELPASAATRQLSDGKPWISVDTTKIPHSAADTQNQAPDAAQQLAYLRNPQGATKVGTETIDGVPTTHYRLSLSPSQIVGATASKAQVVGRIPVDVWIDTSHRVRQETVAMTVRPAASASAPPGGSTSGQNQEVQVAMTMRLSDFGTPVHVTPPPQSQVTDATAKLVQVMDGGQTA
ncbi:LppX_LprAFG lipoprotein [Streptantibioticus parmotrematis]|uniref:LppX_LprAFG lipoprotein n=1 Tax=Streptantibioticus parmotrematis TaxID=2873249 RepID=UPI0033F90449